MCNEILSAIVKVTLIVMMLCAIYMAATGELYMVWETISEPCD